MLSTDERLDVFEAYPKRLRERAWRIIAAPEGESRHQQVVRLALDGILYLASLVFADYRSQRADTLDSQVERQLSAFSEAGAGDYYTLFRLAQNATGGASICPPRSLARVKLAEARPFLHAMECVETATKAGAASVGPFLTTHNSENRPVPHWYTFWENFLKYRNKAVGHFERSGWTDLRDYYEVVAPLLEAATIEALTVPPIAEVLTTYVIGELLRLTDGDADTPIGHFTSEVRGRSHTFRVPIPPAAASLFDVGRVSAAPRHILLRTERGVGTPKPAVTMVGPWYDLFDPGSPPVPLGPLPPAYRYVEIWSRSHDPHRCLQQTQRAIGDAVPTGVLTLALVVTIDIDQDGTAAITFANRCATVGYETLRGMSKELWFEEPQPGLVVTAETSWRGGIGVRLVRDYSNLKQFVCEFREPIPPMEFFAFQYSYRAPRMFQSLQYWDQRTESFTNFVEVRIRHRKGRPLARCVVLEDSSYGLQPVQESQLSCESDDVEAKMAWHRTFPRGGAHYRLRWAFEEEEEEEECTTSR